MTSDILVEPRYIPRQLSYVDANGERQVVGEDWLLDRPEPLVILGDPGMGKTELLKRLGSNDSAKALTARAFLREPDPAALLGNRETLVIDALDEVAAARESDPVHEVLKHLVMAGRPRFILSCRVSDWNGAPARADIEETYAAKPLQLTLEHFSEDDALAYLTDCLGERRARLVLEHYSERGLSDLFGNPQTLRLIANASYGEGELPDTRADLLDKACRQMALEHNERHGQNVATDALLDAAGAMCAMLILSAKDAVSAAAAANIAPTDLALAEISRLPDAQFAAYALGSRLFIAAPGDRRFAYVHRTVAEFLAARWIGQQVEKAERPQLLTRRLIELIRFDGGVPASLRGVHSWLPRFSRHMASEVIAADPMGVLRYGDADGLTVEQGKAMLESLDRLAARDPNFRAGDWSAMRAKGLVQTALEPEVCARITSTEFPFEIRALVLECLAGSDLAPRLLTELQALALDCKRPFGERHRAVNCLEELCGDTIDWPLLIAKLVALKDADSSRLAIDSLAHITDVEFDAEIIAAAVLANSGVLLGPDDRKRLGFAESHYGNDLYRLHNRIADHLVMPVLDALAKVLLPHRADNNWHEPSFHDARGDIARFAIRLIRRQLDLGGASPRQLFEWLNSMERGGYQNDEDSAAIAQRFEDDSELRRAVQRHVLLQIKPAHDFGSWVSRLYQLSWGLRLVDEDRLLLLREIVERGNPADRQRWEWLVHGLREKGRVPKAVRIIARAYAKNDPELLAILATQTDGQKMEDWEKNARRADRARKQRREASLKAHRDQHEANITDVEQGTFGWVINPAKSFLGHFSDIDKKLAPNERIASWLGEAVAAAALTGFEAALHRDDRPDFALIVERYAKGERWNDVYPILAGAAARFLSGTGFADLTDDVLASIAVIEDCEMNVSDDAFKGFEESIKRELRGRDEFYEAYLRRRFEPHLANRNTHIDGFAIFTRLPAEQPLSARLCLEWLERYTDLPLEIERYMAECVVHSPQFEDGTNASAFLSVVQQRLDRGFLVPQPPRSKKRKSKQSSVTVTPLDPDPEQPRREWEGYWTSLLFLLDFDAAKARLPQIGADNREWLWFLTNFYFDRYGDRKPMPSADIQRLIWIVETFRPLWPYFEHPRSSTGDRNARDAAQRIESAIFRLAANPAPEAAEALQRLHAAPEDGYTSGIKTAMARQHQVRVEASFRPLGEVEVVAALTDGHPQTVDDVLAIVCDEIEQLQAQIRRSNCEVVELFYNGGKPKNENNCRNTLLSLLRPRLPHGITWTPELSMQGQDRADCGFSVGTLRLPVEAKGQWHSELWTAAETQLFDRYAQDWQARGRGLYLVFWFGKRKKLQGPPRKLSKKPPATPAELREELIAAMPEHIRPGLEVIVLDLDM